MMLCPLKENEFDRVYSIMDQSFPADEYRPYNEQKALLDNSRYQIFTWKNNDEHIVAFISLWNFEDFAYIEHFAVDSTCRNSGIGSKMLAGLCSGQKKLICLEVEPPENSIAASRISFYERNGFFLNTYPYIQPSISKGRNPVPLMIMTCGKKINHAQFTQIKTTLYTKVYKVNT